MVTQKKLLANHVYDGGIVCTRVHLDFMPAYKLGDKKDDVSKRFFLFRTLKCFIAETSAPIQIPSSHKKFVSTRSSKLDPMLVCFDDIFFQAKSYHV